MVSGIMPIRWLVTPWSNISSSSTLGAAVAAVCLFIRSCWRVAELNGGFNGPLSSKEGIFIALDSVPMIIMSVLLTVIHPEFWFDNSRPLSGKITEEGLEVHIKV